MPAENEPLLTQAERLIRRGDLREAAALLQDLAARDPGDSRVAARLAAVRELAAEPARPAPSAPVRPPSPEELAEARIAMGDLATGIGIYEKLAAKLPDPTRARARLAQLRPPPPPPRPLDPVEQLTALLGRIQSNRRR